MADNENITVWGWSSDAELDPAFWGLESEFVDTFAIISPMVCAKNE